MREEEKSMIKSRKNQGREVGIFLALILALGSLVGITPAKAADLPTVRVVSPIFNPANETFASDGLGQYYAAGGRSFYKYVGYGSTITVTYLVTSNGTTPWADKTISFMVNAPYSGSQAKWEVNGTNVGPNVDGTAGLVVTGKTDAAGKVSFTIKNTDSSASAQPAPSSETQPRLTSGRLYGNMKAVVDGLNDMQQIIDLITFDITKAEGEISTGLPSIRLISPKYTSANSVVTTGDIAQYYSAGVKAWYTYIQAGSKLTLKYKVTKDGVTPMAKTKVTLQVNAPYSGSQATWSKDALKFGPNNDATPGGQITGTTNANGEVTFRVTNTNKTGEVQPATPNAKLPATRLYGTFKPVIAGYGDKDMDIDLVTFDVYTPIKATITCTKGKYTKSVTGLNPQCPPGYSKK
jgi:hypothetical protein